MDAQMLETTLKTHLTAMRQRLDQAAGIARAVEACAETGNSEKAVKLRSTSNSSSMRSTLSSTPRA